MKKPVKFWKCEKCGNMNQYLPSGIQGRFCLNQNCGESRNTLKKEKL